METTTIRTQVLLDKEILEQALQITHLKNKRELLDYALRDTSATKNKKAIGFERDNLLGR
jgi:Arc/MetJ family transcription regulator